MRSLSVLLLALSLSAPLMISAQTVTVPNAPAMAEQTLGKYKISIQVPKSWRTVQVARNEILVRTGKLDQVVSTCMIRLTSIAELKNTSPQAFVDAMSREKFIETAGVTGSKPEIHVFDTALLGGVVARRIVHTQSFDGVPLTYLSHQALRGSDVFTVSCYAKQSEFASVIGTFGMIIGTTRFLP